MVGGDGFLKCYDTKHCGILMGKDRVGNKAGMGPEDLEGYKKFCRIHIEICDLTHKF